MGGNCAGVVFFRWPGSDEALVMEPSEVLMAAGLAAGAQRRPAGSNWWMVAAPLFTAWTSI